MDAPSEGDVPVGVFFAYVRRRSVLMLSAGLAAVVAGCVLAAAFGGVTGPTILVLVVGVALVVGATTGFRCLAAARRAAVGPAQVMELQSWPYRSVRSLRNNRVLVTLDRPGSVERTPAVEFRATWFTPGSAESGQRACRVYGSLGKGQFVLAVAQDGSCFAGRVVRTRQ